MRILVLIKEVPNMEKVKFDSERGVVDRSSAPAEINPFDESALQAAVDLKSRYGAQVTVLTMGPASAVRSLRDAYSRGADEGVLITDRAFGGSDTMATSRTLAAAAEKEGYDLILCGEKSVDGDTAQVGAEVAEILGIPHAYYVEMINEIEENRINVTIENICGKKQVRSMKLPALVGVTKNIAKLKLPTVNRRLEANDKEFPKLSLFDLNKLVKEEVGFSGSPTKVAKIEVPKVKERESILFRDDFNAFKEAIEKEIRKKGVI